MGTGLLEGLRTKVGGGIVLPPDARIHYAYSTLSGKQRSWYEIVCAALAAGKPSATLHGISCGEDAFETVRLVEADHPEVHWLGHELRISRMLGRAEVGLARCSDVRAGDDAALLEAAEAFRRSLPAGADEYTVAKAAFTQVAARVRYDFAARALNVAGGRPSKRPYEATGALADGIAVCTGYAKAVQFLLQHCGMMAVLVSGEAYGSGERDGTRGRHAWLIVRIDGNFYQMDPTWSSLAGGKTDRAGWVSYDYFALTDAEMAPTHLAESLFSLPRCDATAAEYHRREGYCLRAWDATRYTDMVCRQLAAGARAASVKAANEPAYRKMLEALLSGGVLPAVLARAEAVTGCSYPRDRACFTTDEHLRVLTLLTG